MDDNGVQIQEEQAHHNSTETITPAADEVELEIQISDPSDEEKPGNNTSLKEKSNSILLVSTIILLLTELYQRYRRQVKEGFIHEVKKEKQAESVDDDHDEKVVFGSHVYQKVIAIPSPLRFALVTYCAIFLRDVLNNLVPFDLQKSPSGNSQPLLLITCSQAFFIFFPEIVQITIFALCCVLLILLVLPLHIELQIFILMFLVLPASLSYFPELARRASGVEIECGTFRASLMRFVILWAVGFALFLGLVILAALYLSWRQIFEKRGGPRKKEEKVNLSDVLEAVA